LPAKYARTSQFLRSVYKVLTALPHFLTPAECQPVPGGDKTP
jgi:hypothetical protein